MADESGGSFEGFLIKLAYAVDGASKERFTAAVKHSEQDVDKLGTTVSETEKKVGGLFPTLARGARLVKGLAAAWAGFKIGQKVVGALRASLEELNNLKGIADITGASAQAIERWSYFADQTGSSSQSMIAALQGIRRTSRAAASGMKRFADTYRELGIVTTVNGKLRSSDAIVADLIEKFKNMDQAKREFYAQRMGLDDTLIASLVGNDVQALIREFDRMAGAAETDFDAAAQSAYNLHNEIGKIKTLWKALWTSASMQFFKPFAGAVKTLREGFMPLVRVLRGALGTSLRWLAYLLRGVAEAIRLLLAPLEWTVRWFDSLSPSVQNLIKFLSALTAGFWLLTKAQVAALLTNPFVLIGAAILGVLALLDDFVRWYQGKGAGIDWGKLFSFEGLKEAFKPVTDFFKTAFGPIIELLDWFKGGFEKWLDNFKKTMADLPGALAADWQRIKGLVNECFVKPFDDFWNSVEKWFAELPNKIRNAFAGVKEWFISWFYGLVDMLPDVVVHGLGLKTKAEREAEKQPPAKQFQPVSSSDTVQRILSPSQPSIEQRAREYADSLNQSPVISAVKTAAGGSGASRPLVQAVKEKAQDMAAGVRDMQSKASVVNTPVNNGAEKARQVTNNIKQEDNRKTEVRAEITINEAQSPEQTGREVEQRLFNFGARNNSTPASFIPADVWGT